MISQQDLDEKDLEITRLKKELIELREQNRNMKLITENMLDIVHLLNEDGDIIFASPSMKGALGYNPEDMIGTSSYDYINSLDIDKDVSTFRNAKKTKNGFAVELRIKHAAGYYLWFECVGKVIVDDKKNITVGVVISSRDVTERKKLEEEIRYCSLHDPITGLYNRTYFEQLQIDKIKNPIGLIMIDVDGLKLINDTLGHSAGDFLLKKLAELLKRSIGQGTVMRIGGDEFAVLLACHDIDKVEKVTKTIKYNIGTYNKENVNQHISISLGYAAKEDENVTLEELFKEADNYMYRAKLHRHKSTRSSLVQTLMTALEARDYITEGHGERLENITEAVATELGLAQSRIYDLRLLAHFHDIGKVGIPDRILFKEGPLIPEECLEMQRHSEIGYRIANSSNELLPIADWILKHHERWDGKGYPLGLKKNEIPLECRILSIVDAYDAMINDRPYRKAMSHQDAVEELIRHAGTQFDPQLIPIVVDVLSQPNSIIPTVAT